MVDMSTLPDAADPTDGSSPAVAPSVPAENLDLEALSMTLRELAWVIHRTAPERAGVGPIPTTEIALLKQVLDVPGSTVSELSRSLGIRQSNTSAAISGMERRGFVTRVKNRDDRRVTRIMPTPEGAAEHEAIAEAWKSPVLDALGRLDTEQRDRLLGALPALGALFDLLRPGR